MKTRKEQIRKKARELGQQYFPDEANIWARGNIEAEYVESACIEMAEWLDQQPHWIPVEERLPEKDGKYLFYDEVLGHEVSIYYDGVTLVPSVTHWMLLPKAPRKEDKK